MRVSKHLALPRTTSRDEDENSLGGTKRVYGFPIFMMENINKINFVDARKTLAEFKKRIDPELDAFFLRVIAENRKQDENIADTIKYAQKITMSGGKRARAAFMYYGYMAAGGKDFSKILKTAISIELIHSFLLVHDDIIDKDEMRHGVKTIHTVYEELAQKHFKNKDNAHFGNSMAIVVGDMLYSFGNRALFESGFDSSLLIRALHEMQRIVFCTIVGEAEDIYIENSGKADEEKILQMYKNKTAKYTLEGPLYLGAILAGADEKILKSLSAYSIPAGIAFQIQDDILGVFGEADKTGKPVGSDVRQGKLTILVAKALEKSNAKEKAVLEKCLGKIDLTTADLDDFRHVIKETGSLEYAQNLAASMINESKNEISKATINGEAKEFLLSIADYMLNREM